MKRMGMRNYTISAALRACVLLGFALFFFLSIQSGRALKYVHPRNIPVLQFAIVAMTLCAIFLFIEAWKPRRRLRSSRSLWVFIFPLVAAFLLPAGSTNAVSLAYASFNLGGSAGENLSDNGTPSQAAGNGLDENTYLEDTYDEEEFYKENFSDMFGAKAPEEGEKEADQGMIVVDTDNYITWMDDIYDNLEKYKGRRIQLTGFVYREDQYKESQFVSARLMMVCCAADLQTVGFLCKYENAAALENDTWVEIVGTIEEGEFDGSPLAMVSVEQITPIEEPERSYVYPF